MNEPTTPRRAAWAMLAALAVAAGPAQAQTKRDLGDWRVAAGRDGAGCLLTQQFALNDGTTLVLGLDADGSSRLTLLNPNWSIKPKARLPLTIRLTGARYPKQSVVGLEADGQRGFVTAFDPGFPARFAASNDLRIDRGDVPVVRLALDGSAAAVAELRRCVAAFKSRPTVRPAAPNVPRDPFATEP